VIDLIGGFGGGKRVSRGLRHTPGKTAERSQSSPDPEERCSKYSRTSLKPTNEVSTTLCSTSR
jgi:hypothetical protein